MDNERSIFSKEEQSYSLDSGMANFFNKVFLLMMVGVFATFAVAYGTIYLSSANFLYFVAKNYYFFIFAELGVVLFLRFRVTKLSYVGAMFSFVLYAVLTGFTFVTIALIYGADIFTTALITTSAYFLILSVVGFTTKADLSDAGNTLRISLIAIIVLSFINLFFYSSFIDLFITVTSLSAYLF